MAAQAQAHPRRQEVEFPPNVAITVNMMYAQPRLIAGQYGERYMFTTTDNRIFFLNPVAAGKIAELGINVREPFTICKKTSGKQGEPVTWEVARITGEQSNGTMVIPKDSEPEAPGAAVAPKPMARAESAGGALVEHAIILVDAYAAVLEHALTRHQGRVKPDEVRSIFLTCAINRAKGAA